MYILKRVEQHKNTLKDKNTRQEEEKATKIMYVIKKLSYNDLTVNTAEVKRRKKEIKKKKMKKKEMKKKRKKERKKEKMKKKEKKENPTHL